MMGRRVRTILDKRDDIVLVFDTGPLMAAATGLPFKALSVASFIQNNYYKAKEAASQNKEATEIAEELREDFVGLLERKEEASERALYLVEYCLRHPSNCVIPQEVLAELRKYSFQPEVRDLLRLIGSETERTSLVAEFNKHMRDIGRGENSPHPQTVLPEFFEKLAGPAFSWKQPSLAQLKETDPDYERWYNIISSFSKSKLNGVLSETDKTILAYTAYLNWKGIPAIAIIGDNAMRQIADHYGIPIYYIYYGFRNTKNLGRLQLKPKVVKIKRSRQQEGEEGKEEERKTRRSEARKRRAEKSLY